VLEGQKEPHMFGRRELVETVTLPKSEYLALRDAAAAGMARQALDTPVKTSAPAWVTERQQQSAPVAFNEAQIALLLEAHYKDVLTSKTGRAMWRKLLREAATAEAYTKIGK
jgi:hypothetical protein